MLLALGWRKGPLGGCHALHCLTGWGMAALGGRALGVRRGCRACKPRRSSARADARAHRAGAGAEQAEEDAAHAWRGAGAAGQEPERAWPAWDGSAAQVLPWAAGRRLCAFACSPAWIACGRMATVAIRSSTPPRAGLNRDAGGMLPERGGTLLSGPSASAHILAPRGAGRVARLARRVGRRVCRVRRLQRLFRGGRRRACHVAPHGATSVARLACGPDRLSSRLV